LLQEQRRCQVQFAEDLAVAAWVRCCATLGALEVLTI